jgi:hypothetical protein
MAGGRQAANAERAMIEVFIERWTGDDGVTFPWSVWRDGKQVFGSHGRMRYDDPGIAEYDALRFCQEVVKAAPDRVNRL